MRLNSSSRTKRLRKITYLLVLYISICMFLLIGTSHLAYSQPNKEHIGLKEKFAEKKELSGVKGKLDEGAFTEVNQSQNFSAVNWVEVNNNKYMVWVQIGVHKKSTGIECFGEIGWYKQGAANAYAFQVPWATDGQPHDFKIVIDKNTDGTVKFYEKELEVYEKKGTLKMSWFWDGQGLEDIPEELKNEITNESNEYTREFSNVQLQAEADDGDPIPGTPNDRVKFQDIYYQEAGSGWTPVGVNYWDWDEVLNSSGPPTGISCTGTEITYTFPENRVLKFGNSKVEIYKDQ